MSRDAILTTIRQSLQASRPFLEREAARAPHTPPPHVHPAEADLADQFTTELGKLTGQVHRCADVEAALDTLQGLLQAHQATAAITWNLEQIDLPGLATLLQEAGVAQLTPQLPHDTDQRKALLQELEPAQVCISGVDAAIAESATLVLTSGAGRARLASLLAPVYIAVVRESQLVRGLGAAINLVQQRYGRNVTSDLSSLMFITGPSRTADIEMTLSLGIHGPKTIHVVLLADAAPAA